jgi:hypothetical protein
MAVPNMGYSTTRHVSLNMVAVLEYSLKEYQRQRKLMERLAANLYAVFLDQMKRDEPPHEADWLYEDDICRRELPAGAGRDVCESLKADRLHVAQFLTHNKILWFDAETGKVQQGRRGRPRMCKCDNREGEDVPQPRYFGT